MYKFCFCIIAFVLLLNKANAQNQTIRFGKTQQFKPLHKETEKKINTIAYKAYTKLFADTMEVPLNRHFESDSCLVFVGVSFKYNIEKLYKLLTNFSNPVSSLLSPKKDYFYIQAYYGKVFVNRYAYYSKRDKLVYILNYTFAPNKPINLNDFQKIIIQTVKK